MVEALPNRIILTERSTARDDTPLPQADATRNAKTLQHGATLIWVGLKKSPTRRKNNTLRKNTAKNLAARTQIGRTLNRSAPLIPAAITDDQFGISRGNPERQTALTHPIAVANSDAARRRIDSGSDEEGVAVANFYFTAGAGDHHAGFEMIATPQPRLPGYENGERIKHYVVAVPQCQQFRGAQKLTFASQPIDLRQQLVRFHPAKSAPIWSLGESRALPSEHHPEAG